MHSVTRTIFPVFASKVVHGVILLTWLCKLSTTVAISGARTNWKVGCSTGPPNAGIFFLVVPLHFFGSKSTITVVVLVSAFVMVNTVWSLVCCSSTYGAPRTQPFVKVGGGARAAPYTMESAPLVAILSVGARASIIQGGPNN